MHPMTVQEFHINPFTGQQWTVNVGSTRNPALTCDRLAMERISGHLPPTLNYWMVGETYVLAQMPLQIEDRLLPCSEPGGLRHSLTMGRVQAKAILLFPEGFPADLVRAARAFAEQHPEEFRFALFDSGLQRTRSSDSGHA